MERNSFTIDEILGIPVQAEADAEWTLIPVRVSTVAIGTNPLTKNRLPGAITLDENYKVRFLNSEALVQTSLPGWNSLLFQPKELNMEGSK